MYYENYEKIRQKRGVSDYKVAEDAGISRSTISEWKTGIHTPSLENLKKIAKALECSVGELIGE